MADGPRQELRDAHKALDGLRVPRSEQDDGGERVFSLAERITEFWPYPVAVTWAGNRWVRADTGESWIGPSETPEYLGGDENE